MFHDALVPFAERRIINMKEWKNFLTEEEGIGVVEVILILVVLIGLVIIFKKEITALINDIFAKITERAGQL